MFRYSLKLEQRIRGVLAHSPVLYNAARAIRHRHLAVKAVWHRKQELLTFHRVERGVRTWERKRPPAGSPVVLMNVSSRINHISINTATDLLLGWALRLANRRVIYYSCHQGLPQCHAGTSWPTPYNPPPCETCTSWSRSIFPTQYRQTWNAWPVGYDNDLIAWLKDLERLPLTDLKGVSFEGLALGQLAWATLKWALHLGDPAKDEAASWLLTRYIIGSAQLARHFRSLIANEHPQAVVVYNGSTYPEAVVATIAREHGIPVVSYEIGFLDNSIYFSHGQATAYDVVVPDSFELGEAENQALDDYLFRRFQGDFKMGQIRIWPEIKALDGAFLEKAGRYRQTVSIFTNIVSDTSQTYADVGFANMFDWLNMTMTIASKTPGTLFVVRVHPNESIPFIASRDSVSMWWKESGWSALDNVELIAPDDHASSYDLIRRSKFSLVYNSSIGLEAVVLGTPVICGGRPRYESSGAVMCPRTAEAYQQLVMDFLATKELPGSEKQRHLARRYYYYTLFKACIVLSGLLCKGNSRSFQVAVKDVENLMLEHSREIAIILRGILQGAAFTYP